MTRDVKIAAPGFILMDEMRRDMPGTLKKVAALGYGGIELLGFFGHDAGKIAAWCKEAGLLPFSAFVRLKELTGEETEADVQALNDFDKALVMQGTTPLEKLQYVRAIGCQYIGLLLPDDTMDDDVMAKINRVVALAQETGLTVHYHNHAQEYLNRWQDGFRMDYIMARAHPLMRFEPDLGWMEIGGCRCEGQIEKYAHRMEIVHLKDYWRDSFDTTKEHLFRPVGYGVMDWARILPLCEKLVQPKWYTLDHDKAYDGDIYGELKMQLDYVKNMLKFC
ncbi:MAG: TIM barrel protein [Clostridia bacterium]|nr:TIM barrel protein [Clostridia bacterium]